MICSKISQRECDKFDVLDDMVVSELKSNIVVILSEHVKKNLQKNKHTLAIHCHLSFVCLRTVIQLSLRNNHL